MLRGIDPLLSPELLKILCEMGHGDELYVVDANFTASTLARGRPIVRLDGISLQRACEAILSVFPLDPAERPVGYMKVCNTPEGHLNGAQQDVLNVLARLDIQPEHCEPTERFAFYERTQRAYAFVVTGELRTYANFCFKKAVVSFPAQPEREQAPV
ncbi:RbsD/FucU family protein [Deinococcus cellulosilyticus]|uniref:Fucose isomerase n=1 Tax=Deinococcus cellulosilyticus (strain DSM 18568 / NBRC 106333 / KACC 11606 / 5516J-15) TaxID=1223518 RepID=A0A511N8C7_DEIC1|nr:RbsD/FucU domain-containing protein [Deinococcus cellulosilyticus]GEM49092.1 fucose isomerase [Deinococcus cellulosilyticus NBRC 106333 = KACC 11606]